MGLLTLAQAVSGPCFLCELSTDRDKGSFCLDHARISGFQISLSYERPQPPPRQPP